MISQLVDLRVAWEEGASCEKFYEHTADAPHVGVEGVPIQPTRRLPQLSIPFVSRSKKPDGSSSPELLLGRAIPPRGNIVAQRVSFKLDRARNAKVAEADIAVVVKENVVRLDV
jgi:hypothetical protein